MNWRCQVRACILQYCMRGLGCKSALVAMGGGLLRYLAGVTTQKPCGQFVCTEVSLLMDGVTQPGGWQVYRDSIIRYSETLPLGPLWCWVGFHAGLIRRQRALEAGGSGSSLGVEPSEVLPASGPTTLRAPSRPNDSCLAVRRYNARWAGLQSSPANNSPSLSGGSPLHRIPVYGYRALRTPLTQQYLNCHSNRTAASTVTGAPALLTASTSSIATVMASTKTCHSGIHRTHHISPPLVSSPVVSLLEAGCPRPRLIT
jgi:hypothetical protein